MAGSSTGKLLIRRASVRDAAPFARLMGHDEVYPALLQMPYPDEEMWRARLAEGSAPGKLDLPLVAELDGAVVGSAGLHPVSMHARRRHACQLGMCVAPEVQGRGVGTALLQALCDYADGWIGALRLELTVYTDNERAIRLYRRFGFELEGTFRAFALRHGVLVDAHAMARLHPSPPRLPTG